MRLSTPHICTGSLPKCHPIIITPLGNFLRKYTVTVLRIRLQALNAHAMYTVCEYLSTLQHIIITWSGLTIEMVS